MSLALIWVQQDDRLVLRAAAGTLNSPLRRPGDDPDRGRGVGGCRGLARDVVIVEEPAADTPGARYEPPARRGHPHVRGRPLAARHARVGVLAVYSRRPRRPSPGTLDALGVLTTQAALAIESVRLFADTERRRRSAEALASVSQALAHSLDPRQVAHLIADNVLALLRVRDVTLFEVQPRTGNLVSVAFAGEGAAGLSHPLVMPPGVGASGRAVATRREVFTPDILNAPGVIHTPELRAALERAGYRAVVAVPLLVNGEPIGALAVAAGRGRGVDEESRQLLARSLIRRPSRSTTRGCLPPSGRRAPRPRPPSGACAIWSTVVDAIVTEVEIATRRVLFVNGRVETLLGYPVEQWLADPSFWRSRIHPDDCERVFAMSEQEIAAGRDWAYEYRMRAADGRVVWVRDSVTFRGDRLHCLKVDVAEPQRGPRRCWPAVRTGGRDERGGPGAPDRARRALPDVEALRERMHCTVLLVARHRPAGHGAAPVCPLATWR